jgi:hypothetical protein
MRANGWRYAPFGVLVGGMRQRHFDGIRLEPNKLPKNAHCEASHYDSPGALWRGRVHAALGFAVLLQIVTVILLSSIKKMESTQASCLGQFHAYQIMSNMQATSIVAKNK